MLELCLLRHADADWVQGGESDFDRRLSKQGHREVSIIGSHLAVLGLTPDHIVCSPAIRVRQTVEGLAPMLNLVVEEARYIDDIYAASVTHLLAVIRRTPPTIQRLLLVGHNPGLSGLVGHLCGSPVAQMPTCGLACLQFELSDWQQVGVHRGSLTGLYTPSQLSA